MTNVSLQSCPITVDDVEAAIAFYRDALGLSVLNDVPAGQHRWVTLGAADHSGPSIVISDPGAGRSDEDADVLQRLVVKGSGPGPYIFAVDDLDAAFEQARAAGAEVIQEPISQPWGVRDCAFRDPAGNLIRINQAG